MMIRPGRFNFYLLAAGCAALLSLMAGCATDDPKDKKKMKVHESTIRYHVELSASQSAQGTNALVGRTSPFTLPVDPSFFLSEFLIDRAAVVDTLGGFAISIQFNTEGTYILEQYTTVYRGRRAGILAEFGQIRWIAAPVMASRIVNGQHVFTPDMTREEADYLVSGLNRVAELVRKGRK